MNMHGITRTTGYFSSVLSRKDISSLPVPDAKFQDAKSDYLGQTSYHILKTGSRNKSENNRPVSLTSLICKLLERLIKDHMVDFLVRHTF